MSKFMNVPTLKNEDGNQTIKRYKHSEITINHNGTNAKINQNGTVTFNRVVKVDREKNEVEYDEITLPASLIFKVAGLLKATRTVEYLEVKPVQSEPATQED